MRDVITILSIATALATSAPVLADGVPEPIQVPFRADADIKLDGRMDELLWGEIRSYDDMVVIDPDTLVDPRYKTDIRYFYTEDGLYVGGMLKQPAETQVKRLASRDASINVDSFGLTLDTSGEGLYGYWFSVMNGGTVSDGKVAPERQFSREWDGPWSRATTTFDDGWGFEMFLPWSMMAMPDVEGDRTIGMWANRKVASVDERWSTPALPFTSARFMSALRPLQFGEVKPAAQFSLFPYTSVTYNEIEGEDAYRAGLDLFWRPSPNFQLTATANPDFGSVESDDVDVNLTAFETFFPEKRLFFLEGNEVFNTTPRARVRSRGGPSGGSRQTSSTFNPTPTTLVNTRRIGGTPNVDVPDDVDIPGEELGRPTELVGAVKLTGQSGGFRYGFLSAAEDDVKRRGTNTGGQAVRLEQDGRDFGVARLLYESAGEGRFSAGWLGSHVSHPDRRATVHGVDLHGLSRDGKFSWDAQFMRSDVEGVTGYGALLDLNYVQSREIRHSLRVDALDDELDISDLGFIRRNDAMGFVYGWNFTRSQGLKRLRNTRRSLVVSYEQNSEQENVRGGLFWRQQWTFNNLLELRTEVDYFPASYDDRNTRGNGTFKGEDRFVYEFGLGTDTSKTWSFSGLIGRRQEQLGGWTTRVASGVSYQPSDRFSLDLDISYFRRDGWILYQEGRELTAFAATEWQPRLSMDVFLSARQQLKLSLQWAGIEADEQKFYTVPAREGRLERFAKPVDAESDDFTLSRMVAQLRYRWEIAPLSDLFVVYTRGSNLANRFDDSFDNLFVDALEEPVIDVLVIKLRYRFG